MTFFNYERLFVSASSANYTELKRVQGVSSSFNTKRGSPNHIGGNKTYSTTVQDLLSATVNFDYVGYEAYNEGIMGFSGDFIGKIISGGDIRNYSIQISGGGSIDITGAALTSLSISASVNDYPKHSVSFDVFEMRYWTGYAQTTGTILYPTGAAILPGNLEAQVSGNMGVTTFSIQDFSLDVSVDRDYSNYINEIKPTQKRPRFPIEARVKVSAYVEGFATGDISSYFSTTSGVDFRIIYKDKQGNNTNGGFRLTNAYLTNQEMSNTTMERTMITFELATRLGIVDSKQAPKGSLYIGM